jgi:hypothetical protein
MKVTVKYMDMHVYGNWLSALFHREIDAKGTRRNEIIVLLRILFLSCVEEYRL